MRDRGPIEILCKEIDFPFDLQMEDDRLLVSFVGGLVHEVGEIRTRQATITRITGAIAETPSDESGEVLSRACELLTVIGRDSLILRAIELHSFIHEVEGPEDGPCDHLIDMLSSCVSAIRFGLEFPCHSRHAAEASNHIWKHKYGVHLFDDCTPAWQKDWARRQLQRAMMRLALASR